MKLKVNAFGFSLVELMVTVSIIGILTTIGGAAYWEFAIKSKYSRAKYELTAVRVAIIARRLEDDKILTEITGLAYPTNETSLAQWKSIGYQTIPIDPWGSYYGMDEGEERNLSICVFDALRSNGRNRLFDGTGDGDDQLGDDLVVRVPFLANHPDCTGSIDSPTGGEGRW